MIAFEPWLKQARAREARMKRVLCAHIVRWDVDVIKHGAL